MRPSTLITLALTAALGSVAVVGGRELGALQDRLEADRRSGLEREAGAAKLARDLQRQTEERTALITEINRLETALADLQRERQAAIGDLRSEFQTAQDELRRLLSSSTSQLELLEGSLTALESSAVGTESPEVDLIHELKRNLDERWSLLEARIDTTDGLLASTSHALASVEGALEERTPGTADLSEQWNALMGPVVKLTGADSVGSGVRLESIETQDGHRTLVLTAWHVVRDIVRGDLDAKVPVSIYDRVGIAGVVDARLIDFDAGLDVALLELDSRAPYDHGAKLPSRESVAQTRIFQPITAVGCPLGNDPVPSRGEVSDTHHYVDGNRYWMINAPTFIGNSGGGIFNSETHELVGIFSKIYNYGGSDQTIIPHMGLMTPMDAIYDWVARVDPTAFAPVEAQVVKPVAPAASAK